MSPTLPPAPSYLRRCRQAIVRRCALWTAPLRHARIKRYLARHRVRHGWPIAIDGRFPRLANDGEFLLGDNVSLDSPVYPIELMVGRNASLSIGSHSYINQGCTFAATRVIEIGERCLIGEFVAIHDTNFHAIQPDQPVKTAPVHIGHNVWIGHRAIILAGVTIGDHAVIGAGAVVTRNVPARTIVGGNPARPIRTLDCPDEWRRP